MPIVVVFYQFFNNIFQQVNILYNKLLKIYLVSIIIENTGIHI